MASQTKRPRRKIASRTNYEEDIADYVIETDESCSSESVIDVNDFDVKSETGSDCDESERADSHDLTTSSATLWESVNDLDADSVTLNSFTGTSGPVFNPVEDTEPVQYFDKFFAPLTESGQSLWKLIVIETNKYYQYYLSQNHTIKANSKVKLWKDIDVKTMRAFIGILLNMSLVRKHSFHSYWDTTHFPQATQVFRKTFKLETFKLILHFFHVSDRNKEPKRRSPAHDQIYKFRPMFDHLNATWSQQYKPPCTISIDESIVGFKGHHNLVKYIRIKKHHQWGPKEYNLCDAKTCYCFRTLYHTSGMPTSVHGQPYKVCETLMSGLFERNHHLVVDNYYTSVPLCEEMLKKGLYVTGIIQAKCKGLPQEMKHKLKQKEDIIACRKVGMLAINWMDRKQAQLLTTHASAKQVEVVRRRFGDTRTISQVVQEYNAGMGCIDMRDQMADAYAAEFRTVKCLKKVLFHLIDRTLTNAYICYKKNSNRTDKPMTHHQFIIDVVESLIGDYKEPHSQIGRPSFGTPASRITDRHFLESIPDKKRK
ncbi:piggyBac transposable element-derived protein 4-like [Watersipora subatra]|uniref:piggyBac transposable element-derived protein 4-like n=1 Tax=Watersipora subatra TaxID=2589382 RepID=UPI00355AE6B9